MKVNFIITKMLVYIGLIVTTAIGYTTGNIKEYGEKEKGVIQMSEDLKLYLIVAIKNTLIVIGFIILAIVFQKWWISLFSALFWTWVSGNVAEENNKKE